MNKCLEYVYIDIPPSPLRDIAGVRSMTCNLTSFHTPADLDSQSAVVVIAPTTMSRLVWSDSILCLGRKGISIKSGASIVPHVIWRLLLYSMKDENP